MWRYNATVRQGLKLTWFPNHPTEPVSNAEFVQAFKSTYRHAELKFSKTIGLAISGGVDSMALATLYAKSRHELARHSLPEPHGIIIDHKVRSESTEEALWVAEELRQKLNMKSTIVPLTWPKDMDPTDGKGFETNARTLRYQALGRACRDHNINSLLVAHHADDQAETIMMRLASGHFRGGLRGMQPSTSIPECYGIHGVYRSEDTIFSPRKEDVSSQIGRIPFPIENGGVQVIRPLLNFAKTRLIATCEEHEVAWAEDRTNRDPTVASRNAIRHIVKNHKLPEALSNKSLVSLAQSMQDRTDALKERAEKIFNETDMALDIETGSLKIDFPRARDFLGQPIITDSDKRFATNVAVTYLDRVVQLISPSEPGELGPLAGAVEYIWPILIVEPKSNDSRVQSTFTVKGVLFRPYEEEKPQEPQEQQERLMLAAIQQSLSSTPVKLPESYELKKQYYLRREPIRHRSKKSDNEHGIFINPWTSPWHLFDGRYWLFFRDFSNEKYVIRTLSPRDLQRLILFVRYLEETDQLCVGEYSALKTARDALRRIHPAEQRFTIPAIFRVKKLLAVGEEASSVGKVKETQELVALPSLGISIGRNPLYWDIRYKKVDFGARSAEDIVVHKKPVEYTVVKKEPASPLSREEVREKLAAFEAFRVTFRNKDKLRS